MRQVNVAVLVVYSGDEGNHGGRSYDGGGEGMVCADEVQGVVRKEDVRATEKEKVVLGEGFRVGDLVRAAVVGESVFPTVLYRGEVGWVRGAVSDEDGMIVRRGKGA